MDWYRIRHTIGMCFTLDSMNRAKYLKKHDIFRSVGDNCMVMFRKIPLYPKLISLGNNVWIASNVSLVPHDVIHHMVNYMKWEAVLPENIGCIDIKDNVFIGANTTVLPNVSIGPDTIVAAGTLVNKSIGSGVYGGVPARYICSLEDLIDKRKKYPGIPMTRSARGGLSMETVNACWERFHKNNDTEGT